MKSLYPYEHFCMFDKNNSFRTITDFIVLQIVAFELLLCPNFMPKLEKLNSSEKFRDEPTDRLTD